MTAGDPLGVSVPTPDVVTRAKEALEGIHGGPWRAVNVGNMHWGVSDGEHGFPNIVYAQCSYDGYGNGSRQADAELVPELVAEIERLRDGLRSVEHFARYQALSDRVRTGPAASGYHSEERYWLDLLAIIERIPEVSGE